MTTNPFFTNNTAGEQDVVEDLTIEAIKMYGRDFNYIPRVLVNEDLLYGEDPLSSYGATVSGASGYSTIEMYIDNVDGFEGDGDFIAKFGLEVRDSMNLVVSKKRFNTEFSWHSAIDKPREGDLIYFPLTKGLFEIKFVEHENPFYQMAKLFSYKLSCELFQYSQETISSGITAVDAMGASAESFVEILGLGTAGGGTYQVGETIYQGTSLLLASMTASVSSFLAGASGGTLGIFGGTAVAGSTVIGVASGASYSVITATGSTVINIPVDPFADNITIQSEGQGIIDWTETDPFSEGTI